MPLDIIDRDALEDLLERAPLRDVLTEIKWILHERAKEHPPGSMAESRALAKRGVAADLLAEVGASVDRMVAEVTALIGESADLARDLGF